MSIYIKLKYNMFFMLVLFSLFIYNVQIYADIIGCDEDGIVCLNDNLELYSNDFRTLDLDFDGKYELYYFDINGRLKTNVNINGYYINKKGQQTTNGNITIIDLGPNEINNYQIDNLDYYYIAKVKSKLNENWEIQGQKEERLKARVSIDIPEIAGENRSIVDKINNQLETRGFELLKIYAKDEAYKRNTRKLIVSINKFVKNDIQKICFVPMLDNSFYFNFDVCITLDNKSEIHKDIGLCVTIDSCKITNSDFQNINKQVYQNEEYVKTNDNATYSTRYKDYVQSLKNEYNQALIDYIDSYESYIKEYENQSMNSDAIIRAISNYVYNIDSVYNKYIKIAHKSYQKYEIDEETYKYIEEEFKNPLYKYRDILNKNLQVEINAIKELEIEKIKR